MEKIGSGAGLSKAAKIGIGVGVAVVVVGIVVAVKVLAFHLNFGNWCNRRRSSTLDNTEIPLSVL